MFEELKSDSKGTSLEVHSRAVSKISVMMAERLGLDDNLKSIISTASLLHDIGKCYKVYQNYICNKIIAEEFTGNGIPLLHHEISWAILKIILPTSTTKSQILYTIYWHHSKEISSNMKEYATAIINALADEDLQHIIDFYNYLTGDNKTLNDTKIQLNDDSFPTYYLNKNDHQNMINLAALSCVISADRCVSKVDQQDRILIDDDFCNRIIDELTYSDKKVYKIPGHYDLERFNYQLGCIKDIGENQTTILKAPSGFGKTITGILSWIINGRENKKLIWVCPRNIIAETLYRNIIDELGALNIDAKVELFLTGKVQQRNFEISNPENEDGFTSDIIITNIDNFLAPSLNNYARSRMFSIISNYVIFDEFHELIADEALFACFINIMNVRHKLSNSQTLLMSATPSIMNSLWDGEKKTKILPENNNHYNAPHNKNFKVNIIKDFSKILPEKDHLVIVNSIANSQKLCHKHNFPIIAHSKYTDDDRKTIVNNIFNLFGKGQLHENKVATISAPLIQASMNISYTTVSESIKSPEDTFQRLGRNNRFGEYDIATFNIYTDIINKNYTKGENGAIKSTYNEELRDLWKKYLEKNIDSNRTYTLNELYILYNKFNQEFKEEIIKYISEKYRNSLSNMSTLFPRKRLIKTDGNQSGQKQSSIGLRDNGEDKIFCIFPIHGTDLFTDPIYIEVNGPDMDQNEDGNTQRIQEKVIQKLLNDDRFDYNKYPIFKKRDKFTSKKLFNMSKNSKTPYICFHKVYHPKLGLINTKLLD